MPGEDLGAALDAAVACRTDGIKAAFTRLGENLTDLAEADAVADHYVAVLDEIAARGLAGEVSIKLTQLGYDLDVDAAFRHFDRIAGHAAEVGTWAWIDMEGSAYVEGTIAFYERVRATHDNVGLCLQSYLLRTPADVQRLLPLRPAIRLVKGAYDEPAAIAYRSRRDVDAAFLATRHDARPGGPRRRRPPRGRDARRRAHRADRPPRRRDRARAGPDRGRDALRDPGRPAAPARAGSATTSAASSPTASTGTRGTCAASPSVRRT